MDNVDGFGPAHLVPVLIGFPILVLIGAACACAVCGAVWFVLPAAWPLALIAGCLLWQQTKELAENWSPQESQFCLARYWTLTSVGMFSVKDTVFRCGFPYEILLFSLLGIGTSLLYVMYLWNVILSIDHWVRCIEISQRSIDSKDYIPISKVN
jgi:hypothetical protein